MSLGDGIWLVASLIPWYLSAVVFSLSAGNLEHELWLPAFGAIAILSGASSLWLAVKNKGQKTLWILLPLSASFVLVFISGLFRGKLRDPGIVQDFASGIEVLLLVALLWILWPRWRMGMAFAAFSSTVWLVALFMSSMSFTDTWL